MVLRLSSRTILLLLISSPVLVSARWRWPGSGCWQRARRTPGDGEYLAGLAAGSRPLPASAGASDWPRGHLASPAALQQRLRCIGPRIYHTAQSALHYKVINRTVFVEPHHWHDFPAAKYRKEFDEQLAIATWLYKDFPDVDLFVFFGDLTGGCDLDIPWLQYAVTAQPPGGSSSNASSSTSNPNSDASSSTSSSSGRSADFDFDLSEFILPLESSLQGDGPPLESNPHMRGWAIPTPDEWQLGMTRHQLQAFAACINQQFPWASKKPDVVWRGRDSGGPGRWSPAEQASFLTRQLHLDAGAAAAARGTSLANKRVALAAAAAAANAAARASSKAAAFDVALHGDRYLAANDPPGGLVQRKLVGSYLSLVTEWAGHKLSVSIDGFGPPFRLPQQLLLGSVVLKMASPMREHFTPGFAEGRHYLGFNYNLSNFVEVAAAAVEAGKTVGRENERLQAMAAASQAFAVESFHVLAQLDAVMGAVLGVKQHSPWKVTIPAEEREHWVPIAAGPLRVRTPGLPRLVRQSVLAAHRLAYADHVLLRQQQKMSANLLLQNDF